VDVASHLVVDRHVEQPVAEGQPVVVGLYPSDRRLVGHLVVVYDYDHLLASKTPVVEAFQGKTASQGAVSYD
jgi:hypothetical protein